MDAKQLREAFAKHGIKKVKVGGFDVDGVLRGKYVSLDKFWGALEEGFGFCDVIFGWDIADVLYDNASVTGWHTGYPDTHATIDLDTFRVLPWEPDTAAFLLDFVHDGRHAAPGLPALAPEERPRARQGARATRRRSRASSSSSSSRRRPSRCTRRGSASSRRCRPGCSATRGCARGRTPSCATRSSTTWRPSTSRSRALHTETGPGVYEVAIRYDEALRDGRQGGALQDGDEAGLPRARPRRARSWRSGTRSSPARAGTCISRCGRADDERLLRRQRSRTR